MFAGKGILHSEGPSKDLLQKGGVQELIQIWVNVPKKNKWDEPFYQYAHREKQPQVLQQEGVDLRLASGEYDGKTGTIHTYTPVITIIGTIAKCKQVQLTATPGYWMLLYIAKGRICVNQESVEAHNLVVFEKDNEEIIVTAEEDSTVLILSAEPINEPVTAKDNFVMNTPQEIEQAMADYQNGMFGYLDY